MAFTDRFIKMPVEMYNKKQAELTGKDNPETFTGFMAFLPMEVRSYMPAYNEDHEPEDKVVVDFKGMPEAITVLMSIREFEQALNDFMDKK